MPSKHYRGWRVRWFDARGKRQSKTFSHKRDADRFEHEMKSEVAAICHGLRPPLPERRTFGQLCDAWLELRAPQKRSAKDDASIIGRHLRPAFGELDLAAINVEHVDRFIASRTHLDKKTVHNHLTLLGSLLRYACDFGWLARLLRIRKPKIGVGEFYYLRTDDEIRRFLFAAKEEGDRVALFYQTAINTGMRAGELASLEWADVDFERRLITVQRSFDGPTKTDCIRHVPILDALLPALRAWKLRWPGPIVFPNERGTAWGPSGRIFQEILHRVLERAGLPEISRKGKKRPYITFHGTRHTFASSWMMKGGDIFKLQKILGHKTVQMTMRYAHLAPNAFAEDYDRLRDHLATGGGQVVPMRPAPTRGAGGAVRLAHRPTQASCATGAERAADVGLARQEPDEDAEHEARASGHVGR